MKSKRHHQRGLWLLGIWLAVTVHAGTPATTPQPRRGGTLHLIEPTDLRTLDPAIAYDSESEPLVRLLFRGLLDYDDGVNIIPAQAKDWNVSPDGKTYTFHLRPGTRFSNGREVEAADYVYSFERILSPAINSPGQGFFTGIAGADDFTAGKAAHVSGLQAPDKQTLIIQLREPQFTFRYVLAMTFAAVVPRDVAGQYGKDFQYHLAGSGPYRLADWQRGVRWRFNRNPYYTGPDGYVDAVEVMIGGDGATAIMMLERNEVDRVLASPVEAIRFQRDPRLRSWLVMVASVNTDYLFMNAEMKPFDNPLVCQAVNYAVNKAHLVRLDGGFATVADGIVPAAMSWTNAALPHYDHDPDKARALLREAGFPNGFKTSLEYMEEGSLYPHMAESVQQDLQQVGIDVSLQPVSSASFDVHTGTRHQVAFGLYGWYQDFPDPSDFLDVLFNGEHITETDCNDIAFYNNRKVNGWLDQAMQTMNPDERTKFFHESEAGIMQDAPWAPLINEVTPVLYNPRVHGTQPHPVWLWRYEWMWLDP